MKQVQNTRLVTLRNVSRIYTHSLFFILQADGTEVNLDLSAGLLAEHFDLSEEDSSDDEEECYSPDTSMSNTDENNRAHLYRAAIILKNIIKDVPIFHTTWPSTADDFNKDAIFRTVPPELFDFLCWLIGLSDEPSSECLRGSFGESYNVNSMRLPRT